MKVMLTFLLILSLFGCRDEKSDDSANEPDPLEPSVINTACVIIASCAPPGSLTVAECATTVLARPAAEYRFTNEIAQCIQEAGADCSAVESCLPTMTATNPCQSTEASTLCVEGVVIGCFAGEVESETDCTSWGLTCADPYGDWTCQGDGQSCISGSAESCDGSNAVMCLGVREARFDCRQLIVGSECVATDGRARCLPPNSECSAVTDPGVCDGDFLRFCSATGMVTSVDCTTLGFGGCVEQGDRFICGAPE